MEWLTSWFEWFGDILTSIYDFFVSLIENLIMLFKYIALAFEFSVNFINAMPTWLTSACFATLTVSVLYMILGRSSGGGKSD